MEIATLDVMMAIAVDHGGYIPTRAARELGLAPARLVTLARRGGLERIGHGLYRIPGYPIDRHDDLIRAVLWTNERGAISHETALGLYELADVNPIAIDVTVEREYRIERAGGERYRVHHADLDQQTIRVHDGVRVVDVATAIRGAIVQGVGTSLIFDAIDRARRLGWITEPTATDLRAALKA
jgi:predicted transcriptional regulator of viral defense system